MKEKHGVIDLHLIPIAISSISNQRLSQRRSIYRGKSRYVLNRVTHPLLGGKIYALGGYNGRTRLSSGERYEPQRNQWEMIPPMHRQRSDASAAALQDKIYIVGGFSGREVLNSAEVFDVETNQWSYIHPMIDPRSGVCLVAFRDSLYALGGFNGFIRLSSGNFETIVNELVRNSCMVYSFPFFCSNCYKSVVERWCGKLGERWDFRGS